LGLILHYRIPREFCLPTIATFSQIKIPLILEFALFDFRVHGYGLINAILDMKKPPTGQLALENIYVIGRDWQY
jgi:hypothetical protein